MTTLVCGTCRACCLAETGPSLHPEAGDDPALYETVTHADGRITIKPRKTGKGCRYLGPTGCTIYDTRPAECRAFDCREMARQALAEMDRPARRRHPYRAIFKAGIARLREA